MAADYFKKKSLTDEVVADHLTGLVDQLLRAIESKDEKKIRDLTEPTFGNRLTANLADMSKIKY